MRPGSINRYAARGAQRRDSGIAEQQLTDAELVNFGSSLRQFIRLARELPGALGRQHVLLQRYGRRRITGGAISGVMNPTFVRFESMLKKRKAFSM